MAHSKTDTRYWKGKIFRQTYGDGQTVTHYTARIQYGGRREKFALHAPNQEAAAIKARDIYLSIVGKGWDATLAQYKPDSAPKNAATVGQLIESVKATATGISNKTLEDYARAFRKIIADSFQIDAGNKYDYRAGGRAKWLEKVNSVALADVTPELIQRWKKAFLNNAGDAPTAQRTARISVNSIIAQARSLFSPDHLKFVSLGDIQNPFHGVELEPKPSMRYRSQFDTKKLIQEALKELEPEPLKCFLLAVMAGLRRSEIDSLQWHSFNWDKKTLSLTATQYFAGKSESALSEVDLDPELIALFRGYRAQAKHDSDFVIRSNLKARPNTRYSRYRCQKTFKSLTEWLRKKGVPGKSPLHVLRKEFGSLIAEKHGIHAASTQLRHADIGVTARHYLAPKARATAGLGHLLKTPENIIPIEPDDLQHVECKAGT